MTSWNSAATTEIRVHGIGDHDFYSALGSPQLISPGSGSKIAAASPPLLPTHGLALLNWSRTSRKLAAGILWYVAFPFTLINVASEMSPPMNTRRRRHARYILQICAHVTGVLATVSMTAWLIAIGETVLRYVEIEVWQAHVTGRVLVAAVPAVLIATMLYRRYALGSSQVAARTILLHLTALVLMAIILLWYRPAQVPYGGWPSTVGLDGASKLDAMALLIAGTTVIVAVLALVLVVADWYADIGSEDRTNGLTGAAVLLTTALILTHCVSALIRMAIDWSVSYVARANVDKPGTLPFSERAMTAFDNPAKAADFRLDLVPLSGVVTVVIFVCAILLIGAVHSNGAGWLDPLPEQIFGPQTPHDSAVRRKFQRATWIHRYIESLPATLPPALLATGFGAGALVLISARNIDVLVEGPGLRLVLALLHLMAAVAAVFALLGQPYQLRATMSSIGDLAGFWPVRHHPLAGTSYRSFTIRGIAEAIERSPAQRIALVGHSQGSVLCAWYIANCRSPDGRSLHLVTCGSPLASLYATFFPAHFDARFFRRIALQSSSWHNYWRTTDPIATPVPYAVNVECNDPPGSRGIRAHGDYWIEEAQVGKVAELLLDDAVTMKVGPESRLRTGYGP